MTALCYTWREVAGELVINLIGAIAQFECKMMLERQIGGIVKANKGQKPTARAKADEVLALKAKCARHSPSKKADTTAVFPFDFTKLLWAAVIGYFLFGETPDAWTWLGGATIFSAVANIVYRENAIRTACEYPSQWRDAAP